MSLPSSIVVLAVLGAAGVLGAIDALRRLRRRVRAHLARIEHLSVHVEALARGDIPPLELRGGGGGRETTALDHLERNMAALTTSTELRIAETKRETARQRLDTQVQRALSMAETEDEALDVASRAFAEAAPSHPAELLLANESESELHLAAVAANGTPGCPVMTPSGCAAMRAGQTLRFDDVGALDLCPHLRHRPGGPKPAVCVPLAPTRGATGVLHATSANDTPLSEHTVTQLEVVAAHVGNRLRMLHVLSVFQTQAETDALTGLLNRRSFEQRATNMLRAGSSRLLAIAIADVDHFKKLNDTHGHAAGDHALRLFARVARAYCAARNGFAARLGGEEFAIVLPITRDQGTSSSGLESLNKTPSLEALKATYDQLRSDLQDATNGGLTPFTISIGAALSSVHGASLSELLAAADRALYEAKGTGRDRVVIQGAAKHPMPLTTSAVSAASKTLSMFPRIRNSSNPSAA